ncbi:porin [Thalassotalea agarivorans]|uniref:Phosphate-selective porin OprO and OprP n=1 Tax=Thalassotalea agarivorans TaxID=349064 RepID=A0A1I0H2A5_THASX|nr:porin [Thalassotalea agarivorans]SET76957.1 phosphate-selective porin OprO and OprP [Thalassotalea agarivorans]
MRNIRLVLLTSILGGLTTLHANAQEESNSVWDYAKLYKNEQGDYLNLSGRLQLDSAWFDADQGDYQDVLWRRFRFGFKGQWGSITSGLEADINLNNELGDSYNRLTDAYIAWKANDALTLTFLKQSAGFTLGGKTSSKKLYTPQRNNLTNNLWFTDEYFTGVSAKGKFGSGWAYKGGIYSSDPSDEIGFSDGSYFGLATLDKDFNISGFDSAKVSIDYVFNDVDPTSGTNNFSNILSVSSELQTGDFLFLSDLAMGTGDMGQSDLWGLVLMPTYFQSERLQWVLRYTFISSSENNGIKFGRYEREIASGNGDTYNEFYAGVNYYFNEHKFKVHLGAQYTSMEDSARDGGDYDGAGLTLAIRTYW